MSDPLSYKVCPVCQGQGLHESVTGSNELVPCAWCWDEAQAKALGIEVEWDDQELRYAHEMGNK